MTHLAVVLRKQRFFIEVNLVTTYSKQFKRGASNKFLFVLTVLNFNVNFDWSVAVPFEFFFIGGFHFLSNSYNRTIFRKNYACKSLHAALRPEQMVNKWFHLNRGKNEKNVKGSHVVILNLLKLFFVV